MSGLLDLSVAYTVMSPEATVVMDTAYVGSIQRAVPALQQAGYDGVELQVESPFDFPAEGVLADLRDHGMQVSSLATGPMQRRGLSLSTLDADVRTRTISECNRLIEHASELGTGVSFGRIMEPDVLVDRREHYELLATSLRALAARAADVGSWVLAEPQSPALVTLITEQGFARAFLAKHGLLEVGLIFDTYHVVASGRAASEEFAALTDLPALVQIAETTERGPVATPDPPLEDFLAALSSRGYEGWITMEHLQSAGADTPALSTAALRRLLPGL